jgi:hypothetical protein
VDPPSDLLILLAKPPLILLPGFFESACCESGGEGSRYYARDFRDVNSRRGLGFYLFADAMRIKLCAAHNAMGKLIQSLHQILVALI